MWTNDDDDDDVQENDDVWWCNAMLAAMAIFIIECN